MKKSHRMRALTGAALGILVLVCVYIVLQKHVPSANSESFKSTSTPSQPSAVTSTKADDFDNNKETAPTADSATAPVLQADALWNVVPSDADTATPRPLSPSTAHPRRAQPLVLADLDTSPAAASLHNVKAGDDIEFSLPNGETACAHVNLVQNDDGVLRLGGALSNKGDASFSLSLNPQAQLAGQILLPDAQIAYRIVPDIGSRNTSRIEAVGIADVICYPIPRDDGTTSAVAARAAEILAERGAAPLLDSKPSATAVLYLCFDGATVNDSYWNKGNTISASASTLSTSEITEVWKRVSEDYSVFNISVTTNAARYNNAPTGKRMRCIITPTDTWYTKSVGGVALLDSFSEAGTAFSTTVPCWVFNTSVNGIAEAVSHELGHTLGLEHDGRVSPQEEYFEGQGMSPMSWGPIMGASYARQIVQWSKGEYENANNKEDDIAIIAGPVNGFGYAADEAGDTRGTATDLVFTAGAFSKKGLITSATDEDYYTFTLSGPTTLSITATPAESSPNLDISLELQDSDGVVLVSDNPSTAMNAIIEQSLNAGRYYIKLKGAGYGDPRTNGYSAYGSIGQYTLSANSVVPVSAPQIMQNPLARSVNSNDSSVSFSVIVVGAGSLRYQWLKDGVALVPTSRIASVTSATLTITAPEVGDSGLYTVKIRNAGGEIISTPASLTVSGPPPPSIFAQPQPVTAQEGQSNFIYLSMAAWGAGPMSYQWQKDGVDLVASDRITGVTSSYLSVYNYTVADSGIYRVQVSNKGGNVYSNAVPVVISVPAPPVIVSPPGNQAVAAGDRSVSLTVTASGVGLKYQWMKNGADLPAMEMYYGSQSSTYTIQNPQITHSGSYQVRVWNSGGTVTSDPAILTVTLPDAPLIKNNTPDAISVFEGESLSLNCTVLSASNNPTYQWYKDGRPILGGVYYMLTISNTSMASSGTYKLKATNAGGSTFSSDIVVTVLPAQTPAFIRHPENQNLYYGQVASLVSSASGRPAPTYQWYKDEIAIIGATNSTYAGASAAGVYTVTATNKAGSAKSKPAVLNVFSRSSQAAIGIYPSEKVVGCARLVYRIWVRGGGEWTASATTPWVKLSKTTGRYNDYIEVTVAPNPAGVERTATITIAGITHTLVQHAAGTPVRELWASGENTDGQLGTYKFEEEPYPRLTGITASNVIAGVTCSFFIDSAGAVRAVGSRTGGKLGTGDNYGGYQAFLTQVATDVMYIATGDAHTLFLKADGTLWGAGSNDYGQFGLGVIGPNKYAPGQIATDISNVFAKGNTTLYLKTDGTLWGMGSNSGNQLGANNSSTTYLTATLVASDVRTAALGGSHSLFIKNDGTLWGLGSTQDGQLGLISNNPLTQSRQIATDVRAVAAGKSHTLFIKNDDTLWSLGEDTYGQLGFGSTGTQQPAAIKIASDIKYATAYGDTSYFIKNDGTLWAMGRNDYGQLGDGTQATRFAPVLVDVNVASISAGSTHAMYIKTDATLWAIGTNDSGCFGTGVSYVVTEVSPVHVMADAESVVAGSRFTLFTTIDGSLWSTGYNNSGQLGDGSTVSRVVPGRVASNVAKIAAGTDYSLFTTSDGVLWGMGINLHGRLGGLSSVGINSPAQIDSGVRDMCAGEDHTLYIKNDHTVWGMGSNTDSKLGLPLFGNNYIGTPRLLATDVVALAVGQKYTLLLKNDNTVWGAGYSNYNQLSPSAALNATLTTFTQIAAGITTIAAADSYSLKIDTSNQLWGVGNNMNEQMGLGFPRINQVAVPIMTASNVRSAYAAWGYSLYIGTDNILYAAGSGNMGQLGNGTLYSSSTYAPVAANIDMATAGSSHTLFIATGDIRLNPPPSPIVTAFTPGDITENAEIIITGANFVDVAGVYFNNTPAAYYVVNSPTQITARASSIPALPGPVRVGTFDGIAESAVSFTSSYKPTILNTLANLTTLNGANAELIAPVSGQPLPAITWKVSTDGGATWATVTNGADYSGATEPTLVIKNAPRAFDGYKYYYTASNVQGVVTSNPATLSIVYAPEITDSPTSQTVDTGQNAVFVASATANPAANFKWQMRKNNVSAWSDLANGSAYADVGTNTLTVKNTTSAQNGIYYRIIASNQYGSTPSNFAQLNVQYAPVSGSSITSQSVAVGHGTTLAATVSGYPMPAIQWQISDDGGMTWRNISDGGVYGGATSSLLDILHVTSDMNGNKYRYIATNASGTSFGQPTTLKIAASRFGQPKGIAYQNGILYITDAERHTVQQYTVSSGLIRVLSGTTGVSGTAMALLNAPTGISIGSSYQIYIADTGNDSLRTLDTNGNTIGNVRFTSTINPLAPVGIAADRSVSDKVYFANPENQTVMSYIKSGTISSVASISGFPVVSGYTDGSQVESRLNKPSALAVSIFPDRNLYIADTGNHVIRVTGTNTNTYTFVGSGTAGHDDGSGWESSFNGPRGLAIDMNNNLYVADTDNSTIRMVTYNGVVTTIAGNPGVHGFKDGNGQDAWFDHPYAVAHDGNSSLYVADTSNAAIRKINLSTRDVTTLPLVEYAAPVITRHPQDVVVTQGIAGSLTLTFTATGQGSLLSKWQKDGVDLVASSHYSMGASSLIINNPITSDSGQYRVIVSNQDASVISNSATVTVNTGSNSGGGSGGDAPTGGGSGGGGGGGGGAPTLWYLTIAGALLAWRGWQRQKR